MQRVAFILPSGERVSCMLNPEHIVQRRIAGLAPRRTGSGVITGPARTDTPLLHTGGGRTELELQLLFDVDFLPTPTAPPAQERADESGAALQRPAARPRRDIRDHTRPFWAMAENSAEGGGAAPQVRFVLGKEWNMLAVVEALAERFERFDANGTPGRSWMSMRLVRVPDPNPPAPETPASATIPDAAAAAVAARTPVAIHTVIGAGPASDGGPPSGGDTVPWLSWRYLGNPALWRWLADVNVLADVVWPEPGRDLIIPPAPEQVTAEEAP